MAPLDQLCAFDPSTWRLVMAEVRTDTGKFVSTTWAASFSTEEWWVVIGLHNTIQTVYRPSLGKQAQGNKVITSGEVYEFVERVNGELMEEEGPFGDNLTHRLLID